MKFLKQSLLIAFAILFIFNINISYAQSGNKAFTWPEGKKMGLTLSFDDARLSTIDKGIPMLDKYNVKGTFYVSINTMVQRVEGWKKAVSNGHEIGNHSIYHPCTGNYLFSRNSALEDYTPASMYAELDSANKVIKEMLGVVPVSFAYPCGQKFIGRGITTQSYIPLIAAMFETGRGYTDERPNDPAYCDFAQLTGMGLDTKSFDDVKKLIDYSAKNGLWLILAGHQVEDGTDPTLLSTIEEICKYALDTSNGIWIDNVHNIASYIKNNRSENINNKDGIKTSDMPLYLNPIFSIDQRVEDLLSRMTLEEKLGQLNMSFAGLLGKDSAGIIEGSKKYIEGKFITNIGPTGGFWGPSRFLSKSGVGIMTEHHNMLQKTAVENTRLKIPLLLMEEGVHGMLTPGATVFPEGLALGSTWNMDLVGKVYGEVAKEARTSGIHMVGTVVIEPNRDPRLGRNIEGFSEDIFMSSQIAETIVRNMQGEDLTAYNKAIPILSHFPGQSQPISGIERGEMEISERVVREVFLPPWVSAIKKANALGLMATYATIDNEGTHGSVKLLTDILRGELGFEGLVIGEGGGISILEYEKLVPTMKEAGEKCIKAGVDVSIWHEKGYMSDLWENVQEGNVSTGTIDRSVRRILKVKFLLGLFNNPYVDVDKAVKENNTKESRELALQAAREGIVLLKNDKKILPLNKNIKSIAVIGPNADAERNQLGDYLPRSGVTQEVVSVLEGIRNKVSAQTKITYVKGCEILGTELNEIKKAAEAAKKADVAIVVVGENGEKTNGEGNDMADLDLTGYQEELLKAVYATGTPTIAVLINGRPLTIRWTAENIPVIVEAWMCGEEGGNAIADVIFGNYNPSGRLAITIPRHSGQLPVYYNYKTSKDYWIRVRDKKYADGMSLEPQFEFGFGLSYTTFEYSNIQIIPKETGPDSKIYLSVDVKNTGKREGDEVVQLYIDDVISSLSTPVKELRGFEKINLAPGEKKTVKFILTAEHLSFLNKNLKPVVEPGTFKVMVGSSSKDIRLDGEFEVK